MGARKTIRCVDLAAVNEVIELLGIALRIVGEQPLAPQTLAVHGRITQLGTDVQRETADGIVVERPSIGLEQMSPVVVADLVAFARDAGMPRLLVIIQIVLVADGILRHVALGELVDIVPIIAAQQILDLIVIPRTVGAQVQAADDTHVVADLVRSIDRKVVVELVGMTLFEGDVRTVVNRNHALEILVVAVGELLDQRIVDEAVLLEEPVVLQHAGKVLGQLLRPLQIFVDRLFGSHAGNDLAGKRRRQITIVIAAGIGGILPSEGRITVLTETQGGGGVQARALRSVPGVVEHDDRLVGVADAGVAQLAVLVTDVGIVIIIAEELVSLVGRRLLCTALRRRSQDSQSQTMIVVEKFLGREEVRIGIVIHPVDITVAALARTEREAVRPAVVQLPGGVGDHGAETVHLVAVRNADTQTFTHLRSPGVDVGHAGDAAQSEIRSSKTCDGILVARSVVQTAPQRPGAVTGHGIVETDAIEIDIGILRIVAADVETHLAEAVRRDAVEKVFGRRERRRQRLLVGRRRIAVELGKDRIVEAGAPCQRRNDDSIQIAHILPYAHTQFEVFDVGSVESHAIIALRQILEEEIAVFVGGGGQSGGFERHLDIAQRLAVAARDDLASDAAILRISRSARGDGEQEKK